MTAQDTNTADTAPNSPPEGHDKVAAGDFAIPGYHKLGRHAVSPQPQHDETARFNFLMAMNRHLATDIGPGVRLAYETRVKPQFKSEYGRDLESRHEVRKAIKADPYYQAWSALRRNNMEMRQQAGRSMVLRQIEDLNDKVAEINDSLPTLKLNPETEIPPYLAKVDHHCMPGSYHGEMFPGDVTNAANYDSGLFVTTLGALGPMSEGGGCAVADFVKTNFPDFKPRRILDMGAGLGHNVVPIARAYPDAEVVAVDTGAPMLRYGHARARSMGIDNITFLQADATKLDFPDGHFDWVQTTMFWHETSDKAMARMFAEAHRMLSPGGLFLNVEQPQYEGDMDVFEQFIRDWDAFYNNEPFWSKMHETDVKKLMQDVGFSPDKFLEGYVKSEPDPDMFPQSETGGTEDFGRAAAWYVFGAWR